MRLIKTFVDLTSHLSDTKIVKRMAVANAVDNHTLEAVLYARDKGIILPVLVGNEQIIKTFFKKNNITDTENIEIINIPDDKEATLEAVRLCTQNKADILMKGLVNTDVLLRAILNKDNGLLEHGSVLTYNAALEIPGYHKMLFFTDPAVIPSPSLYQRIAMINYAIKSARKFGIERPKIALVHATEVVNPKIRFMEDYLKIMEMWRDGEFGDVIIDGPIDLFVALDKEKGSIKNVPSPVLGDTDILIFPDFDSANIFYKAVSIFANAQMGGLLQGTVKPCVVTSRSETAISKLNSIAVACLLA